MKKNGMFMLMLIFVPLGLLMAQAQAPKFFVDRTNELVAEMSKEIELTKTQKKVVYELWLNRSWKHHENLKTAATESEKRTLYRDSMNDYEQKLKDQLGDDMATKIMQWHYAYIRKNSPQQGE